MGKFLKISGEHVKKVDFLAISAMAAMLVACGGGGGGGGSDGGTSSATYTYLIQGGLKWSSTIEKQYGFDGGKVQFKESASYICSGESGPTAGPSLPDNFNKEAGWSLPTAAQLASFYKEIPKPSGWVLGDTWDSSGNTLNFLDGRTTIRLGGPGPAHVTCVKKI